MKRFFDFIISLFGLMFLLPVVLFGWFCATISTKSNGFFFQERVGLNGKKFAVVKLKTMLEAKSPGCSITALNTCRITKIGAFLRKTKIDELPQLFNVLVGDMSLVGPRPDVSGYADRLTGKERKVLSVRPGITGAATLYFRNEEVLLNSVKDPKAFNDEVIFPLKTKINLDYIEESSMIKDIDIIVQTVVGKSILGSKIMPFTSSSQCRTHLETYSC